MDFNNWVAIKGNYEKIEEMCKKHCLRYNNVNYRDVLSFIMETLVKRNPTIENEKQFLGGWVSRDIKWEISKLCNKQQFTDDVPDLLSEDKEENELAVKIEEKIVSKIRNTELWDFYYDYYILKLKNDVLIEKYNTNLNGISYFKKKIKSLIKNEPKVREIKTIIKKKRIYIPTGNPIGRPKLNKEKTKKMRVYKGVLQIDAETGKIIKAYPSANDVIKHGFSRESVSKCCNGKLKSHKGYIWKFVNYEKEK